MSGYTPVFSSVFDGTLHGRWPHTGIWVCLLAMADKHGCVDKVPRAIATDIGIGVDDLLACIADFCAPDPDSRSAESDGRRLELIDPSRPWGWRIINHGKYREKARLAAKSAREIEEGANAKRLRQRRATADDRRRPPTTDPSNANTNTNYGEQLRSNSVGDLSPSSPERAPGTLSKSARNRERLQSEVGKLAAAKRLTA